MAITYFGSASNPADNGTLATTPVAVTPPGSMQVGDLVLLVSHNRVNTITMGISQAGGQTWNALTASGTNSSRRVFWCRFNGTWSANPSVSFSASLNTTVSMHVFRPTSSSYNWAVDVAETNGTFAAPGSPYDVTITGITTAANSVAIFLWATGDDNSWTIQTGGFSALGTAQYRNVASTDGSHAGAYKLMPSGGATGNVTNRQVTVVGDAGNSYSISFKEVAETVQDRTITGLGRIAKVVDATITGKGRIAKVVDATLNAVARIGITSDRTINTKARIAKIIDSTLNAVGRVQKVVDQTITAVANIQTAATDKLITAKAAIQKTVDRTLQAVGRIAKIVDNTIDGRARIAKVIDATINAVATIIGITDRTITAKGAVSVITIRTVSAVARIAGWVPQKLAVMSLDTDMGLLSQSVGWNGNILPIAVTDTTPTGAPPGGKGFVIKLVGGVMTLYAWDGTAWIAK